MRLLLLHALEAWFKTVQEAIRDPPDPPGEARVGECVVAFVSVEDGDTEVEAALAAEEVVAHAARVGVGRVLLYPFAHLSPSLAPPKTAYSVLLKLEAEVRRRFKGEALRAPFGWYKAFRVHCAGHPMCELSRTVKASQAVLYRGKPLSSPSGDPVAEALASRRPWDGEAVKLLARFQLHPPGMLGSVMSGALEEWLLWKTGLSSRGYSRLPGSGREGDSGEAAVAALARHCLQVAEGGLEGAVASLGPGAVVSWRAPSNLSLEGLLTEASSLLEGRLARVDLDREAGLWAPAGRDYSGYMVFYKSRAGALVPLAAWVDGIACVGPTDAVAKAILDAGLAAAEAGETPTLPVWLAPVQAAVIPVRSEHVDYARRVAESLAWEGVRTYLDPPTRGLGARIRAAARLWTPYIIVIGGREVESGTVTVRRRASGAEQESMPLEALIEEVVSQARLGPRWSPLPPPQPSQ
ncbi:threonyl-tRNA synthetase editing domain-containing protein [Stetteria hydrogenophila]